MPKIFEFVKLFVDKGYHIFIVTNQSGIGRGYYSLEDFHKLTNFMIDEFKNRDVTVECVEFCPHTPNENCKCRKPRIGMIKNITDKYDIDLDNSFMIGDKQSDIDLAINSNISNSIAINKMDLDNSSYNFKSIQECYIYFKGKVK